MGILGENPFRSKDQMFSPSSCCCLLDLGNELGDQIPVLVGGHVTEGGELLKLDLVAGGVIVFLKVLASASSGPFLGLVEPRADEGLTLKNRSCHVGAWPIEWAGDQSLLDPVGQQVLEPFQLSLGLIADRHGSVASSPELVPPAMELAELLGEVAVEVALEAGHLQRRVGTDEKVVVIPEEAEPVQIDLVLVESAPEDTEDDLIGVSSWAQ